MPPTTTSAPEITIGVIGPGAADDRTITALLEDYFQDKEPTLVVPITKAHFTDALDITLSYAEDNDVPLLAITDGSTARNKSFRELAESAEKQYKTDGNVAQKLVEVLAGADTPAQLFLLWGDETDDDAMLALEAATAKGIPTFDLCDGLTPLGFNDTPVEVEEVAGPPAVLEEDAPEAPPVRRGRKAAPAEAEEAPETPKRRSRRSSTTEPVAEAQEPAQEPAEVPVATTSVEEDVAEAARSVDLVAGTVSEDAPLRPEVADSLARLVYMLAAEVSAHVVARMKAEQLVTPKRPPGRPAKA